MKRKVINEKKAVREKLDYAIPLKEENSFLNVYGVYNVFDMAETLVKAINDSSRDNIYKPCSFWRATTDEYLTYDTIGCEDPSIICSYGSQTHTYVSEYKYIYKMIIFVKTIHHSWPLTTPCEFELCSGSNIYPSPFCENNKEELSLDKLPEPFYKLEEWIFATYDKSTDKFYAAEKLPQFVRNFIEFVSNYRYKNKIVTITKKQLYELVTDYLKTVDYHKDVNDYVFEIKKQHESDAKLIEWYNYKLLHGDYPLLLREPFRKKTAKDIK